MHLSAVAPVLAGSIALAYAIAGLFFLRFWARTRDRLFAAFAIAFWVLMFERLLLVFWSVPPAIGNPPADEEFLPYIYTVRLVAFLLIIWAVIDKNRKQTR